MNTGLAIVGPTASGKSTIAHQVARRLGDIEIVTVDSMQVYRGMNIGTAKPSSAEQREVAYHLLDIVDPSEEFSLKAFQQAAFDALAQIEARNNRPLLVGGTGLYLRAIVDRLDIPGRYPVIRQALDENPDLAELYRDLCDRDPVAAHRIEPGNRRRIVRALEVCIGSDRPFSSFGDGFERYEDTDWDVVALHVETEVLNKRIEQRYADQLANGFLDEIMSLRQRGAPLSRTASQALGYRQLGAHLDGTVSRSDAIEAAIAATRRFARRQRSWFRRDPRLEWIDITADAHRANVVDELVARWSNPPNKTTDPVGE